MTTTPKLLAFAGSLRKESFNHKLVTVGSRLAEDAGAEVRLIRLSDYPMPLYDGDLEEAGDWPERLEPLREHFHWADGLLLSSPEYNSGMTGVFKNTIDWLSRPRGDEPGLACIRGKTAGLLAASPGALGGLRVLVDVRAMLSSIGVTVMPTQFALARAHEAFNDDGSLRGDDIRDRVKGVVDHLVSVTSKLSA